MELFKLALASQPHNAQIRASLAHLLHRIGQYDELITQYKRACEIDPGLGYAYSGLAAVYQELGQLTDARRSLEQAIASEPRNMRYYLNLARIKAMEPNDPHLMAMLELEEDIGSLSRDDQIDAHFAFGTALLDCGLHHRAFEHLLAGNKLKRKIVNYNESTRLTRLERIPTVFTPSALQRRVPPVSSVVPIFIIGMPRSGSTLIEQILASHRAVFAAGESPAFRRALTETGLVSAQRQIPRRYPRLERARTG